MKRNVRRLFVIPAVVIALLGAGMVAVIFFGRPPAPLPLPNPNGYDDLVNASQAVAGNIDNASELNHEALRGLVATNDEALRLLRVGLARRCAAPTDAYIANFGAVTRDLMDMRSLAMVLCAEGRLAEMENRPADAARSYTDAPIWEAK